jgi:hypothetical protein
VEANLGCCKKWNGTNVTSDTILLLCTIKTRKAFLTSNFKAVVEHISTWTLKFLHTTTSKQFWSNGLKTCVQQTSQLTDQLCGIVSLNFGLNNFKASTGWLDRFKDCQQLTYRHVCNKSVSADKNIVSYWNNHLLCRHWKVTRHI